MADEVTVESLSAALATEKAALAELQGKHGATSKEAKQHRLESERLKQELDTATAALTAKEKEAADKIAAAEAARTEAMTKAQAKALRAEIKAAAAAAGARDAADVMALVPADKITLDAEGEPTNLPALIEELKKAKPYLFGAAASGSTQNPPNPNPTGTRVNEMDEAAARAAYKAAGLDYGAIRRG